MTRRLLCVRADALADTDRVHVRLESTGDDPHMVTDFRATKTDGFEQGKTYEVDVTPVT